MDGLTLPNDGVSSVQHISYLRLQPAYDQGGREIPIEILKVQETTSRSRALSKFSVFLSYVYGERLLNFSGNIAACSVCVEMDECGQPESQIEFANGGSLVVSEQFQDMGIDTYIMNRIALWLEQVMPHTQFPSLTLYGSVGMQSDPAEKHGTMILARPAHSSLISDLPPFTPDGFLQEINIIDELNAKTEAARKSESDRIAVRIAHSFVLNKLVRSEFLNRTMGTVIIVQIVAIILLIGYTWPIR